MRTHYTQTTTTTPTTMSSATPSSDTSSSATDKEIDSLLQKEASDLTKDTEIERILSSFQLDAYTVLDLQPGCTSAAIKAQYRKKSLLIHPDKTRNERAPDAFDKLKKAESVLQNEPKRLALDQAFTDARRILIRDRKWTIHDERLKSDDFLSDWRDMTRQVLVETELRRRRIIKANMEEEGRVKRKLDEEVEEKRKKRESAKAWEDSRDTRVSNWRDYRKTVAKKVKKKKGADMLA